MLPAEALTVEIKKVEFRHLAVFLVVLAVVSLLLPLQGQGQQEEDAPSAAGADLQNTEIAQDDDRWRLLDLPIERTVTALPNAEPTVSPDAEYRVPLMHRLIGYLMDLYAVTVVIMMLRFTVKRLADDV